MDQVAPPGAKCEECSSRCSCIIVLFKHLQNLLIWCFYFEIKFQEFPVQHWAVVNKVVSTVKSETSPSDVIVFQII